MDPPTPYRDERESLRAENARLRDEVVRLKRARALRAARAGAVVALVALDAAAFESVRGLLNAASDARFAAGAALVVALVAAHVAVAVWLFARGE